MEKNKKENIFIKIIKIPRVRYIFYLLLWVLFIWWVVIGVLRPGLASIDQNNTVNNTDTNIVESEQIIEDAELRLETAKNNLLKYNFKYEYSVKTNENIVLYKGTMLGNETVGMKESVEGIFKYYLNGKEIYQEVLGERILVEDKTTFVYNNYLSVDHIMEMLFDIEYQNDGNEYTFQINEIYVKITLEGNNIAMIEITELNDSYVLKFSDVNLITSLE